jgi:hypothetical protein
MVNRMLEKIQSTRRMITYRRIQLEQAAKTIMRVSKQNREELSKRFNSHMEALRLYFEDFRQRQSEILNEALFFQEARTEDVVSELNEQLEKLDSQNSNLKSLEYHEDNVLVFMNDIIEDLYTGMIKFSPDINLEGLKIEVGLDTDIIARIDKVLSRSANLMHVNMPALDGSDRETVSYKDLIKNMWNCLVCKAQLGVKQVECPGCKTFRPLETYENLLHRPEKVTSDEVEALKLRRKIEKQIILDLELNGVENKVEQQEQWYMIASDWLFKWKCFVTNKISRSQNANVA